MRVVAPALGIQVKKADPRLLVSGLLFRPPRPPRTRGEKMQETRVQVTVRDAPLSWFYQVSSLIMASSLRSSLSLGPYRLLYAAPT